MEWPWARLNEYEKAKEDLEKALELAEQDDTTFLDEEHSVFSPCYCFPT